MEAPPHAVLRGYGYAVLAAVAAGASIVAAKAVDPALPRPIMLAWMFLCASVALALTHARTSIAGPGTWPQGTLRLLLLHLVFTAAAVLALYEGLRTLDPAVASFLGRTEVLFTVLLAIVILRERFTRNEVFGATLAVAGVIAIHRAAMAATGGVPEGFWITLVGMALMGFAEVVNKKLAGRMPAHTLAFVRAIALAAIFVALSLILESRLDLPKGRDLLLIALVAVLAPVFARTLYIRSLVVLDLSKAAVIMLLQPLFAALTAWVALGSTPSAGEWLGGALLVAGCALVVRSRASGTSQGAA